MINIGSVGMLNKRPVSLLGNNPPPHRDDDDDLEYTENPFEEHR